jgi:ABC-type sugar transport system substrate-binding protein
MNSKMWTRRMAAAAVLAAAAALIALVTAAASQAAPTGDSTSPSFSPTPIQTQYPYWSGPWFDSSFHHRHAAEVQSYY